MNQREYRNKKEEVIFKFRKEFFDGNYLHDPIFHAIVEMLIRNEDPYVVIEMLVTNRNELIKTYTKMLEAEPVIRLTSNSNNLPRFENPPPPPEPPKTDNQNSL